MTTGQQHGNAGAITGAGIFDFPGPVAGKDAPASL
jgi:hypothetical protein